MKITNKKGFTLIELLAVIVILAVIALIATPIIMNVINDAKEGAEKDSAYGIAKALETEIAQTMALNPTSTPESTCKVSNITSTTITCGTLSASYKGSMPTSIDFTFENGAAQAGSTVTFGTKVYTLQDDGEFKKTA
ncbi:MAG: prepilin-type N-terminal cleavage/methylation domain-containing protein [Bacilli bacterium]|jgi:prepilin-type N-terminal cleavage/methylation domain-containing protein|nr:prepilin-type N-terminal cleavage/methylation domain-containing protein [Bacilli bacterium]